jgi:nicotinamidase-related amidase
MQVMFAKDTKWASSAVGEILEAVREVCRHSPSQTVFTRFLTPRNLRDAGGQWRRFYQESLSMLAETLPPKSFDLVPELQEFVSSAHVADRYVFNAFGSPKLNPLLASLKSDTLIISGVEADVCVLATALSAIDFGYRLIFLSDAIASSIKTGRQCVLEGILPRFEQQVEVVQTETVLRSWRPLGRS